MSETVLPCGPSPVGDSRQSLLLTPHEPYNFRVRRIQEVIALVDFFDASAREERLAMPVSMPNSLGYRTGSKEHREGQGMILWDVEKQVSAKSFPNKLDCVWSLPACNTCRLICLTLLLVALVWRCKALHDGA